MAFRRSHATLALVVLSLAVLALADSSLTSLSTAEIDEKLQSCPFVQDLNAARTAETPETSSLTKRIFSIMFPAGPAINSLLATAYISGPPNFLLALCPKDIDPSSLSVMVAFAVGGLLGDTLLHLVPQTFMGEPTDHLAHFVINDPKRNAILGMFIFIGFATFVAMDKTLRIVTGGGGHAHSHGDHSHSPDTAAASSIDSQSTDSLRNRKGGKTPDPSSAIVVAPTPAVKSSALLNLIADFTHNITDGLAMSGAFYAGPAVGATTCLAVMMHEIPHEVGDFALLIQGGFTKWQAMGAQFITALGAFTGTLIGIAIQEFSAGGDGGKGGPGLWGTDLSAGELVLPFTAGTFLFVACSVVPELLETSEGLSKGAEIRKSLKQAAAMALGFAAMFMISE